MHRSTVALFLACVLMPAATVSCALGSAMGGARFADVSALLAASKIPQDAAAVVLLREERIHVRGARGVNVPITEFHSHTVTKVLTEGGFAAARVRVVIPPEGELVQLAARTVAPDGTSTPVDPGSMQATRTVVEGTTGVELRFFQFPKVEVGSVLEVLYTTRTSALFITWASEIASPFPIATYRADVSTPSNVTFDFLLNGTKAPLTQVPDPDGRQRVVTELHDVPALVDEPFAPQPRTGAPWWIYRITELRSAKGGAQPGLVAWDRAVPFVFHAAVAENGAIEGFPHLSTGVCSGAVECVVERALDRAREKEWTGFAEQLDVRDPEEIEVSGTANNMEKALLLWSLLRSADVEAHLAMVARAPGFPVNKTFPSAVWFDHAVVFVPGLRGGTFVDPSCEACAIGQLPEWDRGVEALVARSKGNHWQIDTEWKPMAGEPLAQNDRKIVYAAKIAPNGDVTVDLEEIAWGEEAAEVRLRSRLHNAAESQRSWEELAQARSRAAQVTTSTPWACDRKQGRCRRTATLSIPGYATSDGKKLFVPLELFHSSLEEMIADDGDTKRAGDIEIPHALTLVEELHLHPPAGHTVEALPETLDGKTDFGSAALTVLDRGDDVVVTRTASLALSSMPKGRFGQLARLLAPYRAARSQSVRFAAK